MGVLDTRPAIKRVVQNLKRLFSRCLCLLVLPICELTAAMLRYVPANIAYHTFYRHGFHLLKKHYYLPIPEEEDLNEAFQERRSAMVGLDMNEAYAQDILQTVFPLYLEEFRQSFPLHQSLSEQAQFHLINGSFMAIDAHVYYCFIRHFGPKTIVEIGGGASTMLAAAACQRNLEETGRSPHLVVIEPFPIPRLKQASPNLLRLIEDKVQHVDLGLFTSLEAGDILFIDSSHALRAGGDVQLEYCEILPRLRPGVMVHIHDISLPKPYPGVYFDSQLYWNEQWVLQAFMCFNSRFEVLWPGNHMMLRYPESVLAVFPEYHEMRRSFPMAEPSSFWMRVRS